MALTENKMILLARGIKNGGYITVADADSIWTSKATARQVLMSLSSWGFILPMDAPGLFKVKKAPPESHAMAKRMIDAAESDTLNVETDDFNVPELPQENDESDEENSK